MTQSTDELQKLTKRKLKSILNDDEKTALAAHLVYVSDSDPGIERKKEGQEFAYYFKDKKVTDDEDLLRIKHLVVPPAWEKVWICPKENGHLQATGYDTKNRKQYKYHTNWVIVRNHTKFYRMLHFGKALPEIRKKLKSDLSQQGLPLTKVLALVASLMETTHIRIGNNFYEKEYGSFGLTTLKDKHVKIEGTKVKFNFIGKKGVQHDIDLKNKKLSKLIQQCRDIPGKELFQYYDDDGKHYAIDSGMVNDYIHEISEDTFTAKDFRTWSGTVLAYRALKGAGCCESQAETKRQIVAALDEVSSLLGNTRTVCKKYYVHPGILSLYEEKKLDKFVEGDTKSIGTDFLPDEKEVMKILESV